MVTIERGVIFAEPFVVNPRGETRSSPRGWRYRVVGCPHGRFAHTGPGALVAAEECARRLIAEKSERSTKTAAG